ncbi:MAG: diacylglycerol kinase family lipid kinase, partial [Myxococcota bacterium]|nr:diacylglycerol kinase family lipid kinase [Myxococcota bacterium]
GTASFLIGTLRGLAAWRDVDARVTVDGRELHAGPLVFATAANGRYFGGGMRIAPDARLDDGLLDAVVVPDRPALRALRQLPRLYRGTHLGLDGVVHARGRVLEVDAEAGAARLEVDGEPLGAAPVRIEVLPGALRLRAPEGGTAP